MTSILNVFLYSNYIWIINLVIGLVAINYGIINIYNHTKKNEIMQNIVKFKTKDCVKIDISLSLLFSIVFIAFFLNSINFAYSQTMTSKLLFAISNSKDTIFSYYFYILICTVFFMTTMAFLLSLSIIIINKINNNEYKSIGNIILILTGLVILCL